MQNMKFRAFLSGIFATFFAAVSLVTFLIVGIDNAFLWAAAEWIVVFLFMYTVIMIKEARIRMKFSAAEKEVRVCDSRPWFIFSALLRKQKYNTNVYCCEESIIFITTDIDPYASFRIPLNLVKSFSTDGEMGLVIATSDNKTYKFDVPNAEMVMAMIRNHGWNM